MPFLSVRLAFLSSLLVHFLSLPVLADDSNDPSSAARPPWDRGWERLFDGKTTRGWKQYGSDQPITGWRVIDGALVRDSDGAGDIITEDQFDHFELEFEYRISPGGNSGVMFHVDEALPYSWMSGPEIQILDNEKGADPQHAGWLYGLYQPVKAKRIARAESLAGIAAPEIIDATRPAGEWNHVYLRVTPHQGEVLLNGVRYYRFQKGSPDWKQRVAKSKFSAYPAFGTAPTGHLCLQDHGNPVGYRNIRIRRLDADGSLKQGDTAPLPIEGVTAFAGLSLPPNHPALAEGKAPNIRPVALHDLGKGDFITALQRGEIYRIAPRGERFEMIEIANLTDRVADFRKGNEEGLLGLALHPRFAENRQAFIYYPAKTPPRRSVVSRLTLPHQSSADTTPVEEVLLEIPQPFANHNGGSIAFGPDGYLYIGLGDGGGQNDPLANGQDRSSLLGSILRIDVDSSSPGLKYGIPEDNPMLGDEGFRGEIYAYGFRNTWQLSFDTGTGDLWAVDVGQDRYEEIDRITAGGNYGWSLREGTLRYQNPLHRQTVDAGTLIDPVWQYDRHDGRSITGGFVYRGADLPLIRGHYLFADYVSGNMWALELTDDQQRGVSAKPLKGNGLPVIAFARNHRGSAYFLTEGAPERAFYRLTQSPPVDD